MAASPTANALRPAASQGKVAFGTIAVANRVGKSVLTFAPGSTGNVAPVTTIVGAATGLNNPSGIAFDGRGLLYVADVNAASISVFAPNASGNVPPVRSISGSNTTLANPIGVAVDRSGDIWVANQVPKTILEFAAGAGGNVAPIRTIGGPNAGLTNPVGLELTANEKAVWVTDNMAPPTSVEREFSTHANGDAAPIVTLSGDRTQLSGTFGVTVARDGSVVMADQTSPGVVLTFARHASGNAAPLRAISGASTGLSAPEQITLNPAGEIWVANSGVNGLSRFSADAMGNVAPDHEIVGNATTLNAPADIAVYMLAPGAPRSVKGHVRHHKLTLRWRAPASSGGGIEGYEVSLAKHKSGKYHALTTTTQRHYAKRHPKPGYYDIVAFNEAGDGSPSRPVHVQASHHKKHHS
jgi:hypothetical protein